jgi:hypothetical protein
VQWFGIFLSFFFLIFYEFYEITDFLKKIKNEKKGLTQLCFPGFGPGHGWTWPSRTESIVEQGICFDEA